MKNRDLEKSKERTLKELGDLPIIAESMIIELVDEIETLESNLSDAKQTINELNEQIKNLNEQLNEKQ